MSWIDQLNRRAFGEIWLAKAMVSDVIIAIKMVKKTESVRELEKGVESLKKCISPFIVRYSNVFQKGDEVWVSGYCALLGVDCDGVLSLRLCG